MSELALAAVQLRLDVADFSSEEAFCRRIEEAAARAGAACGDAEHRLLVFPETIGHFLPLIHAPALARRQPTLDRAMGIVAARRPISLLRRMWRARTLDPARALLLEVMPRADELMRAVFSKVAREQRAHVVAGSHLRAVAGSITNTSYTFAPDGALIATTHKVNLVPDMEDDSPKGLGLMRGNPDALPVVDAPWGKLATLICYDGFHCPHTRTEQGFVNVAERADALAVDVIANPAANPWPWNERWVHADPGSTMLRCEQWQSEGLPATLGRLGRVRYGITAHLCAELLDYRFEGPSQILARDPARGAVDILAEATGANHDEAVVARVPVSRNTAAPIANLH